MAKYVITGKKPYYHTDCRFYQPGEVVDIPEFQEIVDENGNKKSVGMRPGKNMKPYVKAEKKAEAPAPAKAKK